MTSRAMLILQSILFGAQSVTGASVFADILPGKLGALVALVVAAAQLAVTHYQSRAGTMPGDPAPPSRPGLATLAQAYRPGRSERLGE